MSGVEANGVCASYGVVGMGCAREADGMFLDTPQRTIGDEPRRRRRSADEASYFGYASMQTVKARQTRECERDR